MPPYRRIGEVPAKRHVRVPGPDGGYLAEELMGTAGFSGASSLLYHRRSPSALVGVEPVDDDRAATRPDHPLVPRHLRTTELAVGGDPVRNRHVLLANAEVAVAVVHADRTSDLYRNATGDELVYVHAGTATLETSFGAVDCGPGDYVVIPMSTTHRWRVTSTRLDMLVVEAAGHIAPPARYLTEQGQIREGAPFCERDLHGPEELPEPQEGPVEVLVRHTGRAQPPLPRPPPLRRRRLGRHLYPYALLDPRLRTDRRATIHQPPPVHQTFEGPGFVVCTFVPRLFDLDPDAIKVPYHHANVDTDEVLFYAVRRLHEPGRVGHRRRLDHLPPGRLRPRPAARERDGVDGQAGAPTSWR